MIAYTKQGKARSFPTIIDRATARGYKPDLFASIIQRTENLCRNCLTVAIGAKRETPKGGENIEKNILFL